MSKAKLTNEDSAEDNSGTDNSGTDDDEETSGSLKGKVWAMAVKFIDEKSPLLVRSMPPGLIVLLGIIFFLAQVMPMVYVLKSHFPCTVESGCKTEITYITDRDETTAEASNSFYGTSRSNCTRKPVPTLTITAGCIRAELDNGNTTLDHFESLLGDKAFQELSENLKKALALPNISPGGKAWNTSLFMSQVNIHRKIFKCFLQNKGQSGQLRDPDTTCVKHWADQYQMQDQTNIANYVAFGIRALYSIHNIVLLLRYALNEDSCANQGSKEHPRLCIVRESITSRPHEQFKYSWNGLSYQDTTGPDRLDEGYNCKGLPEAFNIIRIFVPVANLYRLNDCALSFSCRRPEVVLPGRMHLDIDRSLREGIAFPEGSSAQAAYSVYIPEEYIWPREFNREPWGARFAQHPNTCEWYGPFGIHPHTSNWHFTEEVVAGFGVDMGCSDKFDYTTPAYVPHNYDKDPASCKQWSAQKPRPLLCPNYNGAEPLQTLESIIFTCDRTTERGLLEALAEGQALGGLVFTIVALATSLLCMSCSKQQMSIEELQAAIEKLGGIPTRTH